MHMLCAFAQSINQSAIPHIVSVVTNMETYVHITNQHTEMKKAQTNECRIHTNTFLLSFASFVQDVMMSIA